ncbi:uncharacterized protein Dwil_GK23238 [Drosophila willistoni]|uniref:Uncharacterized protein n=1 Tax=Drosophila willistoni TaxID=7260 RepID=B4NN14_DROWI|nr:uncharacterized protein LOC6652408 [Drosophila willistoni]EDW85753.1 uncharacterized protein Dwil_GK23238 [Drosophila willistoni]
MKWMKVIFVSLLSLFVLVDVAYGGRIQIPKITIKNGDITVHGNCNHCTARATKNSAHLSMKFTTTSRKVVRRRG